MAGPGCKCLDASFDLKRFNGLILHDVYIILVAYYLIFKLVFLLLNIASVVKKWF